MPDESEVAPLYPYNDKFATILIDFWQESNPWEQKIRPSSYYDGSIPDNFQPFLSQVPHNGEDEKVEKSNSEIDPSFENEFSPKQQGIFVEIEKEWGYGPGADDWTNDDVEDLTNENYETIKKATRTYEKKGWATETSKSSPKRRRLTQSRFSNPEAMADGGHEWVYDWEMEKLRERSLWEATTFNQTSTDPRDWFGHKNEDDIIGLFEYIKDIMETLTEVYDLRFEYAKELEEEQEYGVELYEDEKTEYIKSIREELQELQRSLNDFWTVLKSLSSKCFVSVSNWWVISPMVKDNDLPEEYHPTKKKNIIQNRIDAKRWALTTTNLEPLIEGNPKRQAQEMSYPNQVEELEKSVRGLIHLAHYMKEDLLEGTEPRSSDDESTEDGSPTQETSETQSSEETRTFDDLSNPVQAIEDELEIEGPISTDPDGMEWKDFLREYRLRMQNEPSADATFRNLKKFHEFCLEADHDLNGVKLEDRASPNEEPDVRIIPVLGMAPNETYFEDSTHEANWPDRFELQGEKLYPSP
ncbi:hypothetical protein ACFQER_03115 [Halomicroarcula sp. GCM10025894]